MIDGKVHVGHTNFNIVSVFGEQIKNLSSKQSRLNFLNQVHQKIRFTCRLLTQTGTWQKNHSVLTSSVKEILKGMINTVFGTKFRGGLNFFFIKVGGFYQQEWELAKPSFKYFHFLHFSQRQQYVSIHQIKLSYVKLLEN